MPDPMIVPLENATAVRVAVDGSDLSLAIAAMIIEKGNAGCE